MASQLKILISQFDKQPIRTRLIITLACIAVLVLLFDLLFLNGALIQNKKINTTRETLDKNLSQLTTNLSEINSGIANQKNNPLNKQLNQITKEIIEAKSSLGSQTINLIQPQEMVIVLKEILSKSKNLKLISLKTYQPQVLFKTTEEIQKEKEIQLSKTLTLVSSKKTASEEELLNTRSDDSPKIYRHPLEIVFEGGYVETQAFINELESIPQKINFDSFEYSVQEYPRSKITLKVSTLSLSRKWISG
jgi:MSHA biogenesis protein MshJ